MRINIHIITALLHFFCECHSILYTNVINLPQGKIRGLRSLNGDRKFLGIPYATLVQRFQDPGDPPSWEGILDATNGAIGCTQYVPRLKLPVGQEDCLIVNVHTPEESSKKLPVLVWIHGGGYYWGSGTSLIYDPGPLIEKGVIVVTVNYRIGAFGFLCLRINGAPGNAGLKDQVAALRWVKQNIEYFGGDSQSITLFGQSAGSSSVNYLILSQATIGLFQRAIMQSGTALSPFAFSSDPIERASLVAAKLGYNTKNPYELLKIFQNASARDIVMASLPDDDVNPLATYAFRPCAERPSTDSMTFMTKTPKEMLESGNYRKVPTIIGYNDMEGITYVSRYNDKNLNTLFRNFNKALPDNLYLRNFAEKSNLADDVKSFYFKTKYQSSNITSDFIDYFSDIFFHYPSIATTEYMLQNGGHIYNYYFKYDSYRNLGKFVTGMQNRKGAAHSDELFYLFQPIFLWPLPKVEKDLVIIEQMTTLWTNFAKTGSPKANTSIKWVPSEAGHIKFLVLDQNTWISSTPNRRRIEFWKTIYNRYGI